jgi:hypothetical protein
MKKTILEWLKYQNKFVLLAAVILSLSVGVGCQHEQSKIGTAFDEPSTTEGVFKMAYDMETMSFTQLDNPNLAPTTYDNVGMMPKVKKSAIRMTVFDDGTSDWTIKDVEPVNKIVYADKTPPDMRLKTVLTRIDRAGLARFFDKNNTEKHKYQMTIPSMKRFADELRGDSSDANKSLIGNNILSSRGGVNVGQVLEDAMRNGAIVKSISKNVLSITLNGAMSGGSVQTRGDQKTVESVVDTARRVILASTVKDDQGQVVSQVFMKYNSNTTNPNLEMMEQRTYDPTSPANRRKMNITTTTFSNMQVTIH